MPIEFKVNHPITVEQFISLLTRSTLSERRPIDDRQCMEGMLQNSNLIISAWDKEQLVGIARSVTDFHYACYLSDLAIAQSHQKQGIGLQLQTLTQQQLGPHCSLLLLAAPAANHYYPQLGYHHHPRCWIIDANDELGGPQSHE